MRTGRFQDYLFALESLDAQLRQRHEVITQSVDRVPQEQFLVSTDDELLRHFAASMHIDPIVLDEDQRSMKQTETQVDVAGDPNRIFMEDRRGPFLVPGTRVEIAIPFTGEPWLFQYKTNPSFTVFPRGVVETSLHLGVLRLTIERPTDVDPATFKADFEGQMKLLRGCVGHSSNQVAVFNSHLETNIRAAIAGRRQRLAKHSGLADLLDIPLAARPGAPSVKPIQIETKPLPKLPVAPKSGLKPEPGISVETYERILSIIRHEGRTFETTPGAGSKLDEEELRSILLAHLNGHFQGKAAGEVFRRTGKTDIRIEEDNRAAFVGECKVWGGQAQVAGDIDQLLSYLTWRDSKAALIVFSKTVKAFSGVQESLMDGVRRHPRFVKEVASPEGGEWRVVMRSAEDDGRLVTVQIFAFNLYLEGRRKGAKKAAP
jgi:hypothetical protein